MIDGHTRDVFVIAATPFDEAGALDLASTDTMVDFTFAAGVDGLTILGIMGEAARRSPEEGGAFLYRVLDRVVDRVPSSTCICRRSATDRNPASGWAIRKEVLRRRGAIGSALVRAPGSTLGPADHRIHGADGPPRGQTRNARLRRRHRTHS
jgi:dihydrodipicolinate synthase/N-acetylneuraminate lyase